jgi:hypothetical protein
MMLYNWQIVLLQHQHTAVALLCFMRVHGLHVPVLE